MSEKAKVGQIPPSGLDNGLYTQGKMNLSPLSAEEQARLRQLDYKVWGEGKTMQGPLVQLESDEYDEFKGLLAKCGRKLVVVDPAKQFFEG